MFEPCITKLYGVAGNPVLHSLSPNIFNSLFESNVIFAKYLRLLSKNAKELIWMAREIGLSGINITAPFKSKIIPYLDSISKDALKIGAVNTVVKKSNEFYGYNTDWMGVINALKANNVLIANKRCVVFGAGGAGRSAVYGLLKEKAKVCIVNRTLEKSQNVASCFKCNYEDIENLEILLKSADILISTIPPEVNLVNTSWLNKNITIFDANYKESVLLKKSKKLGLKTIDGREWLLYQAIPAFKLFTGKNADEQIARKAIYYSKFKKPKNIAFIGFMGSGKTSISKELSTKCGFKRIDTDFNIEKKTKYKISKIFKLKGEEYFRKLEAKELNRLITSNKTIFSPGGGAVLDEENRDILKNNAIVIWLYSSPRRCLNRIKDRSRPLLNVIKPLSKVKFLLSVRLHYYSQIADVIVSNNFTTCRQTANIIYDEVDKTFKDFWHN